MFNLSVRKPHGGWLTRKWDTVFKKRWSFLADFFCWGIGSAVQKWCFSPTVQFNARLINIILDLIPWIDKGICQIGNGYVGYIWQVDAVACGFISGGLSRFKTQTFLQHRWKPVNIILLSETGGGEEGENIKELLRELLFLLQWIFQVVKILPSSCYSANKCWPLKRDSKFTVVRSVSSSSMTFWVTAAKKTLIPCLFIWELWFCGGFCYHEVTALSWLHSELITETSWGCPCF